MNIWNQKHRPTSWDEYVWTDLAMKERMENLIKNPSNIQHMIFAGHPGVGKTTLARMLCDSLGLEENNDYILIRVGEVNGPELVQKVRDFCESGFSPFKIVILDEADRMTSGAHGTQEQMRWITDKYEKSGCRFILTCNDAGRLKNFVGSRYLLLEFKSLSEDQYLERLGEVAIAENIDLDDGPTMDVFQSIQARAYPDLRQAINLLQAAHQNGKLVNPGNAVQEKEWHAYLLGSIDSLNITELRETLQGLRKDEIASAYRILDSNSDLFDKAEREAVIAIAEAMYRHTSSEYPDVTLLALMCKLNTLWTSKK